MELAGKTVNFLGDSITEGCCASTPQQGFVEILKRSCALKEARNYGIGGTRIARQKQPSAEPKYDLDFCSRVEQMAPDADIIIVFGGTNDHGHGDAPMGTSADRTPDTFHGACHVLFQKLKKRYPHAYILILTPLHRAGEMQQKGHDNAVLEDYVRVIRSTAALYDLPVLDLFTTSKIQAHIPQIAAELTTDGLHPNDEGHAILAREIKKYLEQTAKGSS
ncbi:MAG: SGNH/GDSL hydrolase family protein [Oscillospiraceae bacterium]|nr:SGNH/GDSL hydrolase family protein [Oscillospiraceae bacterium]